MATSRRRGAKPQKLIGVDIETSVRSGKNQKVLEVAAVALEPITYNIIDTVNLVIHYDREFLEDNCGNWQKEHFCSESEGGNGLIDDCVRSTTSFEEAQNALVGFFQRHTTSHTVYGRDNEPRTVYTPVTIMGSSVHFDRSMLLRHFTDLRPLINHQVRDVTSIFKFVLDLRPQWRSHLPESREYHRALQDIEDSVCLMQALSGLLFPVNPHYAPHPYPMEFPTSAYPPPMYPESHT